MRSEAKVSKRPVWALTPEGEGGRAEVRGQPHWGHPGDSPKAFLGTSESTEWSGEFGLLRSPAGVTLTPGARWGLRRGQALQRTGG